MHETGRLLRTAAVLSAMLCACADPSGAQEAPPPVTPPDSATFERLLGTWTGLATHDGESTEFDLGFERTPRGNLLAKIWMPDLNCYATPAGAVGVKDGKLGVQGAGISIEGAGDTLSGNVFGKLISYRVTRGGTPAEEAKPPAVPTGPEPAWTYRADSTFRASAVADHGVVYVGDLAGRFHAVDVATGRARWTFATHGAIYGAAALDANAVYFVSDPGTLHKLDQKSGRERWSVSIGGEGQKRAPATAEGSDWDDFTAPPIVANGVVYVGSADSTFRALDSATGKERWRFVTSGKVRAAAETDGRAVYFGSLDHFAYALDAKTGRELWRFDTKSAVTYGPALADGKVVIGTRDDATLNALDAVTGRPVWNSFWWMSWIDSQPRLVDGVLYIGSSDSRRVRALDPKTGEPLWVTQVYGWTWGTPLVVGDTVYYATAGTKQYFIKHEASLGALDRKTGAIKWRRPIALLPDRYQSGYAGSLAYDSGRVLAAGLDGTLIAIPTQ